MALPPGTDAWLDEPMSWLLHVTEGEDGSWFCSHGHHRFDAHEELDDALAHLGTYAAALGGAARVIIHRLDGGVEELGVAEP